MSSMHLHRCPVCSGAGRIWATPNGAHPMCLEAGRYYVCQRCGGDGYIACEERIISEDTIVPANEIFVIDPVRELLLTRIVDLQPLSCR